MGNFNTRPAAFLSSFHLRPIIKLKNLSAAVNANRRTTMILLRRCEPKVVFFAPKLPDLSSVLNELVQLKCVADGA